MAAINFRTAQINMDTPPVNTSMNVNLPIPSVLLISRESVTWDRWMELDNQFDINEIW
jgi:hypothetical protein